MRQPYSDSAEVTSWPVLKRGAVLKNRFWTIAVVILLTITIFGCKPAATNPNGSETTGTISEKPTSSVSVTNGTPSSSPTPAVSPTITAPSVSPTASAQPSSMPTPNPGSVSLQIEPAYPNLTFDQPLCYTVSGDGGSDVFVVERTGRIKVFSDSADSVSAEVFLDISDLINHNGQEQGLLGLAFHPDYAHNGYFYVNYTNRDSTVIARYTRQPGNIRAADPNSGIILLTFKQPYANHNGGHLAFGPYGYLYIATGDGGSSGDPQNNAQNLTSLLGKILRIDIDQPSGVAAYGIPEDNPFAGNSQGYRPEIFAFGLRNPWRFSFDRHGALWAADVGQNKYEEIDLIVKGGNYGWSAKEGNHVYKTISGIDTTTLIPPIWEYSHSLGESITGGYVYAGSQFTALQGTYIYGDFVSGRIWALWIDDNRTVHNVLILETNLSISSFGINADNELLIIDLGGEIYRLIAAA